MGETMKSDRVCSVEGCDQPVSISDRDGGYCRTHWDEMEAARRAEEQRVTEEAGGPWPQLCPRRTEDRGTTEGQPDTWTIRTQMHKGLVARHCNYCGSLHPDEFMKLVKEGWIVGPTDKSYKAYLSEPITEEEVERLHQQFLTSNRAKTLIAGTKEHHPEMTDEELQAQLERWWTDQERPHLGGSQETKFYFQHLSPEQRADFIRLYNDKTMKIGYPGHFYTTPFFCRATSA